MKITAADKKLTVDWSVSADDLWAHAKKCLGKLSERDWSRFGGPHRHPSDGK